MAELQTRVTELEARVAELEVRMQTLALVMTQKEQIGMRDPTTNLHWRDRIQDLPEELIAQILSYLELEDDTDPDLANTSFDQYRRQLKTLYAVSITSRTLHRIVEPHLYAAVPVTFNKPYVPHVADRHSVPYRLQTTCGENATALVRTLANHPRLAAYVKKLLLSRCDPDFWRRYHAGLLGWQSMFSRVLQVFQRPLRPWYIPATLPESMDPEFELLRTVFKHLPILHQSISALTRLTRHTIPWS